MSKRLNEWNDFHLQMRRHLLQYAEKQYGNPGGNEQLDNYNSEDCAKAIEKYLIRRNVALRGEIELARDCLKMAHYACVRYYKLCNELRLENVYGPGEGDKDSPTA